MLKVAIVCPYDWSHPGGVKSHIRGLAAALRRRAVQAEIVAPSSLPEPEIYSAGRPVPISFNGSIARLCFSPAALGRLRVYLGGGGFDLIHVHEPAIPSVSMLSLAAGRYPAVATFHAASDTSLGYRAAKPVLQSIMSRLSVKIAVSTAARSLISRHFPGNYQIVPNGIDYAAWEAAMVDPELSPLKPLALFVGRPEPRKGLDVFVQGMDMVRSKLDVQPVAVGPRPDDVPEWVLALGPVGPDRLPSIMKAADVFCAPSLGGESFGIVIAEAMAAGTPVVCSDLQGYQEAAAGAALTVPAGDPGRMAEAVLEVLADPSRRRQLLSLGQARAKQLDWESLSTDILRAYDQALAG